jgi:L-alanine-DL-glutamate epimerase-like enolase superfamily enzyme
MKISGIKVTGLSGGTVEGGWAEELAPEDNVHAIVEVITDDGRSGIGSVFTSSHLVEASARLLSPFLIGERADEPARVSEKLRQNTFWQGRGGSVEHAISGIDIALWDLFGKITGQPVARLLGGIYRHRIKPYGSLLFAEPDALREKLKAAVGRGFRAIKLGWKPFGRVSERMDEILVRTARETVGPDIELMVDAGGSDAFWPHGYKWAIRTARMLANYDITWFEEALRPDDFDGFAELRKHSPVPIATGEVLTRRQSFMPLLQGQAVDIVQPDCTKCGGLTEAWRIAWTAHENHVQWVPHGWNTAVGLAADIHLSCAMPVARYVEFLTPSPYMDELVTKPFRPDAEGFLNLPEGPGLGIELNREALKRFRAR